MNRIFRLKTLGYFGLLLLAPVLVLGQSEPLGAEQKRLSDYAGRTLQEKIFVHVDRPLYVVGETMWLKAYCLEANTLRALDVSKIAYLEILDKDSNPLVQTKLALAKGHGEGSLILPTTLTNGTYTLRAYTNWMKNFGPEGYFEAPVTILNPFVLPDSPVATATNQPAYDLQFFPEGGSLVAGVENRVAFRSTGRDGLGAVFAGTVIDAQNDTLLRFQPKQQGMGSFLFAPRSGQTYHAILQDNQGQSFTYPLPAAQSGGYAVQVRDSTAQLIKVVVRSANSSTTGSLSLLIHAPAGRTSGQSKALQNGQATFLVNKKDFSAGINRLTVFDQNTKPVAERLYFGRPAQKLNLTGTLDQVAPATRQKVRLDLSANTTEPAELSLAIYRLDSLPAPDQPTIDSYLLLTGDLKGTIEAPASYFRQPDAESDAALDLVMLTHGWTRYRPNDLTATLPPEPFRPEYGGQFIKGRAVDTRTEQPARDVTVYLAAPDLRPKLFLAISDSLGNLRFEVDKLNDRQDIIVQTDYRTDSTYRIEISSPFSERYTARRWPQYALDSANADALLTRSVDMQALNAFAPRPVNTTTFVGADTLGFYGQPSAKYLLDDYTRFPTTEEVMREYVPGVFVKKRKGKFQFAVVDQISPGVKVFSGEPLVLMDGVPVFDTDRIMAFNPLKIKKLEVIDGTYYLGPRSFSGVVSYGTYKGDLAGLELDPSALVVAYDFAQSRKEFYAPRYETDARRRSRLPDFRNLLHWAPALITDAQSKRSVDFYTSDQTGTYRVVVQGITPSGAVGSTEFTFEVKPEARQ